MAAKVNAGIASEILQTETPKPVAQDLPGQLGR